MAFTDDDLKMCKEGGAVLRSFLFDQEKMRALFVRLEAAEVTMETLVKLTGSEDLSAYQTWRKTAGK